MLDDLLFRMKDFCLLKVICLYLIVNLLEEPPITYCITHLSLMTLHSELLDIILFGLPISKSLLISFCGSHFMRSKKEETFQDLIETDSHKCPTIICVHTHSEKGYTLDIN